VVLALLPRLLTVPDNGDDVAFFLALLVRDVQLSAERSPLPQVPLLADNTNSSECCLNSWRMLLRRPRIENWRKNDRCFPMAGGDGDMVLASLISTRAPVSDDSALATSTSRVVGSLHD